MDQMDHERKYLFFAVIVGLVVVLDQISKAIVLHNLALYESISVIPGLFNLTHIHNPGGAFGFLAQTGSLWRHWIFLAAALLALGLILYFYRQTQKSMPYLRLALALIFGGAVGNLIDRVRFGEVIDFLDVYVGHWHWPAFNVADSAVSIGVIIFMLHIAFKKMPF
jgi:signal peptidase II